MHHRGVKRVIDGYYPVIKRKVQGVEDARGVRAARRGALRRRGQGELALPGRRATGIGSRLRSTLSRLFQGARLAGRGPAPSRATLRGRGQPFGLRASISLGLFSCSSLYAG